MDIFRSSRIISVALMCGTLAAVTNAAEPKREAPASPAPAKEKSKIDINKADATTLQSLPGITPEIAHAIIAARPFKTLADLDRVHGLTPERLEQLRQEVTIALPIERHRLGEPPLEPTGRPAAPREPTGTSK